MVWFIYSVTCPPFVSLVQSFMIGQLQQIAQMHWKEKLIYGFFFYLYFFFVKTTSENRDILHFPHLDNHGYLNHHF